MGLIKVKVRTLFLLRFGVSVSIRNFGGCWRNVRETFGKIQDIVDEFVLKEQQKEDECFFLKTITFYISKTILLT